MPTEGNQLTSSLAPLPHIFGQDCGKGVGSLFLKASCNNRIGPCLTSTASSDQFISSANTMLFAFKFFCSITSCPVTMTEASKEVFPWMFFLLPEARRQLALKFLNHSPGLSDDGFVKGSFAFCMAAVLVAQGSVMDSVKVLSSVSEEHGE